MERKYPESNRIVFCILSNRIRICVCDFTVFASFSYFKCKMSKPFSIFLLLIRNIPNLKFSLNRIWLPIITVQATRQRQVWSTDAH
jgi:hypothetical protein